MRKHLKFPFCCKEDSIFFSTLFENYISQREVNNGFSIINEDYKLYSILSDSDLELLFARQEEKISKLKANILEEVEKKFRNVAGLLFIYYIKLLFNKLPSKLDKLAFLNFIEGQSIYLHTSLISSEAERLIEFIKILIKDISVYEAANI